MTDDVAEALVRERLRESGAVIAALLESDAPARVAEAAAVVAEAIAAGGKLLTFGNGGSAADAQHIAAELVGRYVLDRAALPAVALAENSSTVTAVANDYSYEEVFKRHVEGLGRPGDVALGISTSGGSENVVRGLAAARERGLRTIAFTGASGGRLAAAADICVRVPSDDTPHVQEGHTVLAHALCELVERACAG
ncbi:MAG: D-sedoheptulose 7-phosphate isomerase [Thermoleophilaceae bacterium]|nr:D-sedoheptulose 7-phosphate isomerase [Thermoleophilaceae bacterium]